MARLTDFLARTMAKRPWCMVGLSMGITVGLSAVVIGIALSGSLTVDATISAFEIASGDMCVRMSVHRSTGLHTCLCMRAQVRSASILGPAPRQAEVNPHAAFDD